MQISYTAAIGDLPDLQVREALLRLLEDDAEMRRMNLSARCDTDRTCGHPILVHCSSSQRLSYRSFAISPKRAA